MKLKKMLLGTLGGAVLLLAACGGNKSTTTATQVPSASSVSTNDSQPAVTNMLDGVVENGKVRIDILNDNLGVRFAYGNEAIEGTTKVLTYNATNNLSTSGTATADINFIFVVDKTDGTQVLYHPAIDKEQVAEWLADVKFEGALRVYIAISTGTPNWTKGLNTALDTKLNTYRQ
jgi:hypothetical protein